MLLIMVLGSCVDTTVAPHKHTRVIAPAQAHQITWRPAWVGKSRNNISDVVKPKDLFRI